MDIFSPVTGCELGCVFECAIACARLPVSL